MLRRAGIVVCAVLFAAGVWADAPRSTFRAERESPKLPPGETIPVFPDLTPTALPQAPANAKPKPDRLQPLSRLTLVRYISGEFARAVRPLPTDKKGYRIKVGKEPSEAQTRQAAYRGYAANPGDTVQITSMEFKDKEIILHINGGAKEKKSWRERINIQVAGGAPRPTTTTSTTTTMANDGTPGYQRVGSTLILDFGKALPDMTPDEFKEYIAPYLDFSKQRSASVHWFETLPPEFQEAIKEKKAVVGMDREMVVAAMGRPEQKIRERDPEGNETEDWIYGTPPAKTIFVKFIGEKVVAVREFPR